MQYLRRQLTNPEASIYSIENDTSQDSPLRRWVVSTPQSRAVCNRPELLGYQYTDALGRAVTSTLEHAPFRELIVHHPASRVCVLNFLRGGLNFNIRRALHDAYGLNTHSSAFMSSQRFQCDGEWEVREDMYRKLRISENSIILTGDVIATGTTVRNGLQVLLNHLIDIKSSLRGLVFFTIGCEKAEAHLADFHPKFQKAFPDYEETHLVYMEGVFRLASIDMKLRLSEPGTDLLRSAPLVAPEFAASQYEALAHQLERCTIYDAGSRAFDLPRYVDDVASYWRKLGEEAKTEQLTLEQALRERWPETEYRDLSTFIAQKAQVWQGLDEAELKAMYDLYRQRWTADFEAEASTSAALEELCEARATLFENITR